MAKTAKFYAVKKGRKPGIYATWEECQAQVAGFAGAAYKAFATRKDALAYLRGEEPAAFKQSALFEIVAAEPQKPVESAPEGLKLVRLYSDGGAIGNPGPGGYGVVLEWEGKRRELSAGYRLTTNNRMELLGVINGLEQIKERAVVQVLTDSSYIVNAMRNGAALRWQQANWKRKDGPVPNADLWERLLALAQGHHLTFEWVPGHSGIPQNERCDRLAQAAARRKDLLVDSGYESGG